MNCVHAPARAISKEPGWEETPGRQEGRHVETDGLLSPRRRQLQGILEKLLQSSFLQVLPSHDPGVARA